MICPNCHIPMELEETEWETVRYTLEEFPFVEYVEVETSQWHCLICDYADTTYDAE